MGKKEDESTGGSKKRKRSSRHSQSSKNSKNSKPKKQHRIPQSVSAVDPKTQKSIKSFYVNSSAKNIQSPKINDPNPNDSDPTQNFCDSASKSLQPVLSPQTFSPVNLPNQHADSLDSSRKSPNYDQLSQKQLMSPPLIPNNTINTNNQMVNPSQYTIPNLCNQMNNATIAQNPTFQQHQQSQNKILVNANSFNTGPQTVIPENSQNMFPQKNQAPLNNNSNFNPSNQFKQSLIPQIPALASTKINQQNLPPNYSHQQFIVQNHPQFASNQNKNANNSVSPPKISNGASNGPQVSSRAPVQQFPQQNFQHGQNMHQIQNFTNQPNKFIQPPNQQNFNYAQYNPNNMYQNTQPMQNLPQNQNTAFKQQFIHQNSQPAINVNNFNSNSQANRSYTHNDTNSLSSANFVPNYQNNFNQTQFLKNQQQQPQQFNKPHFNQQTLPNFSNFTPQTIPSQNIMHSQSQPILNNSQGSAGSSVQPVSKADNSTQASESSNCNISVNGVNLNIPEHKQKDFVELMNNPMMLHFMNFLTKKHGNDIPQPSSSKGQQVDQESLANYSAQFQQYVDGGSSNRNNHGQAVDVSNINSKMINENLHDISKASASTSKSTPRTDLNPALIKKDDVSNDATTEEIEEDKAREETKVKKSSKNITNNQQSKHSMQNKTKILPSHSNDSFSVESSKAKSQQSHRDKKEKKNHKSRVSRSNSSSKLQKANKSSNEVDNSIQKIIKNSLTTKNLSSNKFHNATEVNQVHAVTWLMLKPDLAFIFYGPEGSYDFIEWNNTQGLRRISNAKFLMNDEDKLIDNKLALITGPYYMKSQSQIDDASAFCATYIKHYESQFDELDFDQQSLPLFWKFIDLYINSCGQRVKKTDISKLFFDRYIQFHGEKNGFKAIIEICQEGTDQEAVDLLLTGKYKQALKRFESSKDYINSFALAGCLDLKETFMCNPNANKSLSNFLDVLQKYACDLSECGNFLLPIVYSFIIGMPLSDLGLKKAEVVLQYWPLIVSLMLRCCEDFSTAFIINSFNQLISSLMQYNMPITAQLCSLVLNTWFKSEYERNFEYTTHQMLSFKFEKETDSVFSNLIVSFQFTEMLVEAMQKHWSYQTSLVPNKSYSSNHKQITLKDLACARMALAVKLHKHGRITKSFEYIKSIVDNFDTMENRFHKDSSYVSVFWNCLELGFNMLNSSSNKYIMDESERKIFAFNLKKLFLIENMNKKGPVIMTVPIKSNTPTIPEEDESNVEPPVIENPPIQASPVSNSNNIVDHYANDVKTNAPFFSPQSSGHSINLSMEDQFKSEFEAEISQSQNMDEVNPVEDFFNQDLNMPEHLSEYNPQPPVFGITGDHVSDDENIKAARKFYQNENISAFGKREESNKNDTKSGVLNIINRYNPFKGNKPKTDEPEKTNEPEIDLNAPPPSFDMVNIDQLPNFTSNDQFASDQISSNYVNLFNM